jgi:hypothetical protein
MGDDDGAVLVRVKFLSRGQYSPEIYRDQSSDDLGALKRCVRILSAEEATQISHGNQGGRDHNVS